MGLSLAPGSAYGPPSDGITTARSSRWSAIRRPATRLASTDVGQWGCALRHPGRPFGPVHVDGRRSARGKPPAFRAGVGKTIDDQASLVNRLLAPTGDCDPSMAARTPAKRPFARLIPHSQAYAPGLPPRPSATAISQAMVEDPNNPEFSPNIVLGLVFFGQFVDHDLTLNDTTAGQGPSVSAANPIDLRTPALDLDSVYGLGPHDRARLLHGRRSLLRSRSERDRPAPRCRGRRDHWRPAKRRERPDQEHSSGLPALPQHADDRVPERRRAGRLGARQKDALFAWCGTR